MRRTRTTTTSTAALAALAAAQAAVPLLPRVLRRATPEPERARATAGPLTPVPGAFAIWGPLFAAGIAYPLVARRPDEHRTDPSGDALVATALALDVAWSLNAQFRRLDAVSVGLIAAAGSAAALAVERAERRDPAGPADRARAALIGPLAGWLSVAAVANLETAANLRRGRPRRDREDRRAVGLLLAGSALISAAAVRNRGNLPYAAASGWGLAGILLGAVRERRGPVAVTAAIGLAAVTTATTAGRRQR